MKKKYEISATNVVGLKYTADMMETQQFATSDTATTSWGGRAKGAVISTDDDADNSDSVWGETFSSNLWGD